MYKDLNESLTGFAERIEEKKLSSEKHYNDTNDDHMATSIFFHDQKGGGYEYQNITDNNTTLITANCNTTPVQMEIGNIDTDTKRGARLLIATHETTPGSQKLYYTKGNTDTTYNNDDEIATIKEVKAMSMLTNQEYDNILALIN